MQNINIGISEEVKELIREVSNNVKGYDVYLGGGYLRDSYCDLSFKDVDIFLVPNGEAVSTVLYTPKGFRVNYQKNTDDTGDMAKRGVGALVGMWNEKEGVEVQYIIYNKPMTQEDLVLDMDMNINQVMWKPSEVYSLVSEEFLDGHAGEYLEFIHEYDTLRMWSRLERMKNKFPSYYYEDVELTSEQNIYLYEKGEKEWEGSC